MQKNENLRLEFFRLSTHLGREWLCLLE